MYPKETLDKFKIIRANKVYDEVYKYLESHFDNLKIEILGDYEGNLMDLMNKGLLEGWCWL